MLKRLLKAIIDYLNANIEYGLDQDTISVHYTTRLCMGDRHFTLYVDSKLKNNINEQSEECFTISIGLVEVGHINTPEKNMEIERLKEDVFFQVLSEVRRILGPGVKTEFIRTGNFIDIYAIKHIPGLCIKNIPHLSKKDRKWIEKHLLYEYVLPIANYVQDYLRNYKRLPI